MRRVAIIVSAFLFLTACAAHPKIAATHPPIRRIAIIPATSPASFSFENAAPPIGYPGQYWVNKLDSKNKAEAFNEKVGARRNTLGADLTDEVAAALRAEGFVIEILEGLARPANDPDDVDEDKVVTDADAILHLRISEVGLYSSRASTKYIPRVNASGKLYIRGQDDDIYNEDISYGVDAKKGKSWAIMPDPKFAYGSFDEVMTSIDGVKAAFSQGALEISKRMSDQITAVAPH